MINKLQKLKDNLNKLLNEELPTSGEVLELSREIDLLITEYYKQNYNRSTSSGNIERGCA